MRRIQNDKGGINFATCAKTPVQDQRQYIRKSKLGPGEITEAKEMIDILPAIVVQIFMADIGLRFA
jgi:hypothetical protein